MASIAWHHQGPAPNRVAAVEPSAASRVFAHLPANRPTQISIPGQGLTAPIEPVGRRPDGTVEVPTLSVRNLVGWYAYGVVPGDPGPAVLLGHRDTHGLTGTLFYANEMHAGDEIDITRGDGSTVQFVVTSVEAFAKKQFPTARVYTVADGAELRLITCGGDFDPKSESYLDNIIVFAHAAQGSFHPAIHP